MTEIKINELKRAVESQHGGVATFIQTVPVNEAYGGKTIWRGIVSVFDLTGHASATRAYALYESRGNRKCQFLTVLDSAAIVGPREAVRAVVAERLGSDG